MKKKLLLITLGVGTLMLLWTLRGLPDYFAARRAAIRIAEAEDVLLVLSRDFKAIGKDLENLALPGRASRKLFATELEANSIRDAASPEPGADWGVSTTHIEWPVNDDLSPRSLDSWSAWRPLLEQVSYFVNLSIKVGLPPEGGEENPNRFVDSSKELYQARVGVIGLAIDKAGRPLALEAHVEVLARRQPSEGDEPDTWKIESWKNLDMSGTSAERMLFDDMTQAAFPDSQDYRQARTSNQHELLIEYYLGDEKKKKSMGDFDFQSSHKHPGLAIVDLDRDGWDDIYVLPRLGSTLFFRNLGDGTFSEEAAAWGLDLEDHCTGAIFADYDNDGDLDVFVSRTEKRSVYLENDGQHFADKTAERIDVELPYWASSVSAVDYDQDGLLDVYISTYGAGITSHHRRGKRLEYLVKGHSTLMEKFLSQEDARKLFALTQAEGAQDHVNRPGPPNMLLRNLGQGRFGVAPIAGQLEVWRNTFQTTWADYDNDGDPDAYIANDFSPNTLLRNDGDAGFTDVTAPTGTADIGFGMGVSWGDYDRDGLQDIYVTNMYSKAGNRILPGYSIGAERLGGTAHGNTLFRNKLDSFDRTSGVKEPAMLVEKAGWGWGGQFTDLDNDGFLDIYTLSGYFSAPPEAAIPEDT